MDEQLNAMDEKIKELEKEIEEETEEEVVETEEEETEEDSEEGKTEEDGAAEDDNVKAEEDVKTEDKELDPKQNEAWKTMREENKILKEQLAAIGERVTKQEGFQAGVDSTKPPEVKDPEPDKSQDYEGWLEWKDRKLEEKASTIETKVSSIEENMTIQNAYKQIDDLENEYSKTEPTYKDAVDFLTKQYGEELKIQYPSATPAQINQHISQQKLQLFAEHAQRGGNASESLMKMAKIRGFSVKEEVKKGPNLDNLKKNMRKSSNLNGGSESSDDSSPTADQIYKMDWPSIMNMSESDFEKAIERSHRKHLRN